MKNKRNAIFQISQKGKHMKIHGTIEIKMKEIAKINIVKIKEKRNKETCDCAFASKKKENRMHVNWHQKDNFLTKLYLMTLYIWKKIIC